MSTDKRISELTAYSVYSDTDLLEIVDTSDTTDAATGTNKQVTLGALVAQTILAISIFS